MKDRGPFWMVIWLMALATATAAGISAVYVAAVWLERAGL